MNASWEDEAQRLVDILEAPQQPTPAQMQSPTGAPQRNAPFHQPAAHATAPCHPDRAGEVFDVSAVAAAPLGQEAEGSSAPGPTQVAAVAEAVLSAAERGVQGAEPVAAAAGPTAAPGALPVFTTASGTISVEAMRRAARMFGDQPLGGAKALDFGGAAAGAAADGLPHQDGHAGAAGDARSALAAQRASLGQQEGPVAVAQAQGVVLVEPELRGTPPLAASAGLPVGASTTSSPTPTVPAAPLEQDVGRDKENQPAQAELVEQCGAPRLQQAPVFATASGRPLTVTAQARQRAEAMFCEDPTAAPAAAPGAADEVAGRSAEAALPAAAAVQPGLPLLTFATASGRPLKVSEAARERAQAMFRDEPAAAQAAAPGADAAVVPFPAKADQAPAAAQLATTPLLTFATASGRPLKVSEAARKRAQAMFGELPEPPKPAAVPDNAPAADGRFSCVAHAPVEQALQAAEAPAEGESDAAGGAAAAIFGAAIAAMGSDSPAPIEKPAAGKRRGGIAPEPEPHTPRAGGAPQEPPAARANAAAAEPPAVCTPATVPPPGPTALAELRTLAGSLRRQSASGPAGSASGGARSVPRLSGTGLARRQTKRKFVSPMPPHLLAQVSPVSAGAQSSDGGALCMCQTCVKVS